MDGAGGAALSSEEYCWCLAKALRDEPLKEAVLRLPFKSGSGIVSQCARHSGDVFCVRMDEFCEPRFVFVPCDSATGLPLVQEDGTTCSNMKAHLSDARRPWRLHVGSAHRQARQKDGVRCGGERTHCYASRVGLTR